MPKRCSCGQAEFDLQKMQPFYVHLYIELPEIEMQVSHYIPQQCDCPFLRQDGQSLAAVRRVHRIRITLDRLGRRNERRHILCTPARTTPPAPPSKKCWMRPAGANSTYWWWFGSWTAFPACSRILWARSTSWATFALIHFLL